MEGSTKNAELQKMEVLTEPKQQLSLSTIFSLANIKGYVSVLDHVSAMKDGKWKSSPKNFK